MTTTRCVDCGDPTHPGTNRCTWCQCVRERDSRTPAPIDRVLAQTGGTR